MQVFSCGTNDEVPPTYINQLCVINANITFMDCVRHKTLLSEQNFLDVPFAKIKDVNVYVCRSEMYAST